MLIRSLSSFVAVLILGSSGMHAQSTGTDIGGPEGLDLFDELSEGEGAEAAGMPTAWDVNDSLSYIPGYDMYCHWNTDVIFDHSGTKGHFDHDTLRLQLGEHACDLNMPCPGGVTSGYGMRRGRMHYGVDLDLETGDTVRAAFPGMVRISKYNKTFGNVVVVRHYNGLETVYAHLSKRSVEPGDLVEGGGLLGLGGNTGRSYGSHLHFEVRFLDQPIDPALLFDLEHGSLRTLEYDLHKGSFARMAAAKVAAQRTQASRKFHTVRRGDTLSAISRRYGVRVSELCRINGISDRSTLSIGQRIRYN